MAIAKGARVRQKAPTVEGTVTERRFHEDSGGMEYLVEFHGADGETAARWFGEAEVEEVPAAPAAEGESQ